MEHFISPNYTHEKLENPSFDDLVDVFEDRIKYWVLVPAEKLLEEVQHGFIATMSVLFTYFEGIQIYLSGQDSKGKSKEFFIEGFLSVFGAPDKDKSELVNMAQTIYSEGRCGFFHEGMSRGKISYSFARKEENVSLRKCFKEAVDRKWGLDDEPPIIGMTEEDFLK